jgi:flagella basal body P-ring formation protein FlgA
MIRWLLLLVSALFLAAPAAAQTSIELRSSSVVKSGAPVTLADIADISGDDADNLRETPIAEAPATRFLDIDVATVRSALDRAGVRWGRTSLSGSVCTVSVAGFSDAAPSKKADAKPGTASPSPIKLVGPETVRTHVARALAHLYAVEIDDLRALFEERDAELLNTPTAGRRVDVQPTNAPSTSRVGMRVYLFAADRLVSERTISIEVLVRRSVVTASAPIPRGKEISPEDFTVSEQWHAPSAATPCTAEQVTGTVARARIGAGQMITHAVIEAPIVVKKGDIVEVHCLSGAIHLKATRARALETGRDGELVRFQLDGSKNSFRARMSGRGNAVLVLDAPAIPQPVSGTP